MDPREYFKDLHYSEAEPIQWVINQVTPVGLQIFGGAPKSFKSMIADALPAMCAKWPISLLPKWAKLSEGMGGPSILLSGEATSSELAWLYRKGFGCKTEAGVLYINDDPWDFKLDVKERANALLSMLNEVQPRLCIIDPLRKYHSGDENDAAYVETILFPLRKWAVRNSSAIIVVHHARKDYQGQDDADKMDPSNLRGSNAIFGAADSIVMCRCLDRTNGRVRVAAIHKRAQGWCRDLFLGVPGIANWKAVGQEVITLQDNNITKLLQQGSTVEQIAKQLHIDPASVNESIDKIERNK
jgi:hypothetical protein